MVTIQYSDFEKGVIWEEQLAIQITANSSQPIWQADAQRIQASAARYLLVRSQREQFPANRHFFTAIKDLVRSSVAPKVTVTSDDEHTIRVHLHAFSYTFFIHLSTGDEHAHVSDNYFDMCAGEERTILVSNQTRTLVPEAISIAWR